MTEDEFLTVQQLSQTLKLAERTVQDMLTKREMPGFKIRGQWRVRSSDLRNWVEAALAGKETDFPAPTPSPPGRWGSRRSEEKLMTMVEPTAFAHAQEEDIRKTQAELHRMFLDALGNRVSRHSEVEKKPLEVDVKLDLPRRFRVYIFNATKPPGGRPTGEHKIQLMVPGQPRGTRASFDDGGSRTVLVVGYAPVEEVFVLWDAGLYIDFAWSRNVQVKASTIINAYAGKVARQERRLRIGGGYDETVLAATAKNLAQAIEERVSLTRGRIA